jgi:mannose-6-phosphate isomerase-like protein (cupin superfamily)
VGAEPQIIPAGRDGAGVQVRGRDVVIGDWSFAGGSEEVAPLHVHHRDDEAWHVISGALRFRFGDREVTVDAGATVLVPAGVAHTFANAGPEPTRYLIVMPRRLEELIEQLHQHEREQHAEIYRRYESEVLE